MKAYDLFTGNTDDATLTASDGTAPGTSETVNGVKDSPVIVSLINPNAASVQMFSSPNRKPYVWTPVGAPAVESVQVPVSLQACNAYRFESAGAGVEVYMHPAPDNIQFDGTEKIGLA